MKKFEPSLGLHLLALAQTQIPKMTDFSTNTNVNIWTPDFAVFISLKKRFWMRSQDAGVSVTPHTQNVVQILKENTLAHYLRK